MSDTCIFCKIIKKEIPSKIVYENDRVLAFEDISPVAPLHVLIIPKEHIENVKDLTDKNLSVIADIHLAAKEIAKNKNIDDFRLITNCGKGAGQTVFHMHYHIIGGTQITKLI
jgi:histidine triad (HIT) family protein